MVSPHTDTGYDANVSLAVTLVGLILVLAIFAVPWFLDDGWTQWYRRPPSNSIAELRNRSGLNLASPQAYRDPPWPPPQYATFNSPNLSNL